MGVFLFACAVFAAGDPVTEEEKDTGLHLWRGPNNVSTIKVVHPNSVFPYGSARSYYPYCQEHQIKWSALDTSCLWKGSFSQADTFAERVPIGSNLNLFASVGIKIGVAETGEDVTVLWDVEISERPGEVQLPLSTNKFQNNDNTCKLRNLSLHDGGTYINLLRSDHQLVFADIQTAESTSCIVDVNKVYYLNIRPSPNQNCGPERICHMSTVSEIIGRGEQDPTLFDGVGWTLPPARAKDYDLDKNGQVDVFDIGIMMSHWASSDMAADLSSNGIVDAADLKLLLNRINGN